MPSVSANQRSVILPFIDKEGKWPRYRGTRAGKWVKAENHANIKSKSSLQEPQQEQTTQVAISTILIKSRDLRPTKILAMRIYLEEVNIEIMIDSIDTCGSKVKMFEDIVNTGINSLLPVKSKTIHPNEPAWENQKLKPWSHQHTSESTSERGLRLEPWEIEWIEKGNHVVRNSMNSRSNTWTRVSQLLGGAKLRNLAECQHQKTLS